MHVLFNNWLKHANQHPCTHDFVDCHTFESLTVLLTLVTAEQALAVREHTTEPVTNLLGL
jgi:hypothetical protein